MMKHKQINPLHTSPGVASNPLMVCNNIENIPLQGSGTYTSAVFRKSEKHPSFQQRRSANVYLGAKRAFLASYERKSRDAKRLIQKSFEHEEKIRSAAFENQMKVLKTNTKIRADNTLKKEMRSISFNAARTAPSSTGPMPKVVLPPDIQVTENNRQRVYYWG